MIHSMVLNSGIKETKLDERITLILALSGIAAVLNSKSWYYPALLGGSCILLLLRLGLSPYILWRKLRLPLVLAFMAGSSQLFLWDYQGIEKGLLLSSRIITGILIMIVLTHLSTGTGWIKALAWFRVPMIVIELMIIGYNSIFSLWDEFLRLYKAQRMRLGYGSWYKGIRSSGMICATLFTRLFDRSVHLSNAMKCRGYKGSIILNYNFNTGRYDRFILFWGLILIWGCWLIVA